MGKRRVSIGDEHYDIEIPDWYPSWPPKHCFYFVPSIPLDEFYKHCGALFKQPTLFWRLLLTTKTEPESAWLLAIWDTDPSEEIAVLNAAGFAFQHSPQ